MATPTKIAAAAASERLTKRLIDLAARGPRTHCSDPDRAHLWLPDHEARTGEAAILYINCPAQLECWAASAARDERFRVWGGIDRTRHPNNKGTKPGRPRKIATSA
jgi:hypothetical protein